MELLYSLIYFAITFLLVLLIYIVFVNRKRKNVKTEGAFTEPSYLIKRFNLDTRKVSYKKLMWTTTFVNAFIIGLVASLVINLNKLVIQLIVGFVLLLVLEFVFYEIIGKIYVKKGYQKDK